MKEVVHFICEECLESIDTKILKSKTLDLRGNMKKVRRTSEIVFSCNFCNEIHTCIVDYNKLENVEPKKNCCLIY